MNRFGTARFDVAAPVQEDARQGVPAAGETVREIGLVLALHLAFAFAVLLALQAFGVG